MGWREALEFQASLTLEEAIEIYGEPIGHTRRGPVWLIDGKTLCVQELFGLDEIGCGC